MADNDNSTGYEAIKAAAAKANEKHGPRLQTSDAAVIDRLRRHGAQMMEGTYHISALIEHGVKAKYASAKSVGEAISMAIGELTPTVTELSVCSECLAEAADAARELAHTLDEFAAFIRKQQEAKK